MYSYYCNENSSAEQTVQSQRRHQIHMPTSSSTSLVTGNHQRVSPTKSDIVLSRHCQDSDGDITPTSAFILTEGSDIDEYEYEERTKTWPRKRSGHELRRQGVGDSNDPERLAGAQEQLHNVSATLAAQHGSKSAETVFTAGSLTDDARHYNVDPSSSVATVAEELLDASHTVQSTSERLVQYAHQYSVNSQSTPSSFSMPQPFTNASVPYLCPYSGSSVSPYNDTRGHSSPAGGTNVPAGESRHAVDMLFDHLGRSSEQNQQDTASLRSFPTSAPHLPAHSPLAPSPFYLSNGHHSSAADLAATDHAHRVTSTLTHHR